MPGKEDYFLTFNKDEIFKGIIAIEGHFRNVKPGYDAGDLSCIVKHAADIEGHCDEAISHSLIAEGEESSRKFAELRDRVREFRRKVQEGKITPEEGIREIRQIRAFFESFNPLYDISKCRTCGPLPEVEKLIQKLKQPSFHRLEEETAQKVIKALSEKYNVEPPKIEITDSCTRPDFGLYHKGTIKLCRGGVSIRVLTHEFGHYLQDKLGLPLDEREAERFSLEIVKKDLYSRGAKYHSETLRVRDGMTVSVRNIAVIYGGQHIGKGITRAMEYVDTLYPGAVLGQDPSLIVDIAGTIGGILGGLYLGAPFDMLAVLIGGYLSTDLWRHAERMAAAPPAAAVRFVPAAAPAAPPAAAPAATRAVVARKGTYRIA